jgi:hypothetical protein
MCGDKTPSPTANFICENTAGENRMRWMRIRKKNAEGKKTWIKKEIEQL